MVPDPKPGHNLVSLPVTQMPCCLPLPQVGSSLAAETPDGFVRIFSASGHRCGNTPSTVFTTEASSKTRYSLISVPLPLWNLPSQIHLLHAHPRQASTSANRTALGLCSPLVLGGLPPHHKHRCVVLTFVYKWSLIPVHEENKFPHLLNLTSYLKSTAF